MDYPQFNNKEIYNDPNYYNDENTHNISGYGGEQFFMDSKCYYLLIGLMLYTSFCWRRNRTATIRDTDLLVSINNENLINNQNLINSRLISKIKKNIISVSEIDGNSSCSICLDDFNSTTEILFLDCKHIYHAPCILEWITKDPSCPLCRNSELV
jgi:hypothetical protein